jgi:hypothetical protein
MNILPTTRGQRGASAVTIFGGLLVAVGMAGLLAAFIGPGGKTASAVQVAAPTPPTPTAPPTPALATGAERAAPATPVPAATSPVPTVANTRYTGTVDTMTVDALLESRADGGVSGYWQVTNRPKIAGIRYRLSGVKRGGELVLKEFSEKNEHEMDVHLKMDPATGELIGEARNLGGKSKPWSVRLKPT